MKSLGDAARSGEAREVRELLDCIDLEEPGREAERSTDFGLDLLVERVEPSDFCFLLGELSSRFVSVKTRLRGRDRERLLSFLSSLLAENWDDPSFAGLPARGPVLFRSDTVDVTDEPLPILSPRMRPALTSGFKLRMVSRILTGTFSES